jgi:mRNA interferase MazF
LTDWQPSFALLPWFVPIPASHTIGLNKDSGADAFQVKSVSETRFAQRIGSVTNNQLDEIATAIALCVGAP